MWNERLTKRQAEILEMIDQCVTRDGFAPSIREIADAFQISSPNGVVCHLKALEKKGFLSRHKTKSRAIELSPEYLQQVRGLAIRGQLVAGRIQSPTTGQGRLALDTRFPPQEHHLVQVVDDSLMPHQICPGDYLVVQSRGQADDGQLAVFRPPDGPLQVESWPIGLATARSQSDATSSTSAPRVIGVVVGVFRSLP